jgi:hypothetical protein
MNVKTALFKITAQIGLLNKRRNHERIINRNDR